MKTSTNEYIHELGAVSLYLLEAMESASASENEMIQRARAQIELLAIAVGLKIGAAVTGHGAELKKITLELRGERKPYELESWDPPEFEESTV